MHFNKPALKRRDTPAFQFTSVDDAIWYLGVFHSHPWKIKALSLQIQAEAFSHGKLGVHYCRNVSNPNMVKLEHLHVLIQDTSRWSIICVGKNILTFRNASYAFLTSAESNDV